MMSDTTLQEVTKYPHGAFSWVELATTDTEGGKKFYSELLGWTYQDMPIGDGSYYTMFSLHGKYVAALFEMQPEQRQAGMPPHWASYITVDNVDETTAKVQAAGGTVSSQPFDVLDSGRMSVIQDPTGAIVSLWEARNHIGAGYVTFWNELLTRDVAAAADFYRTLLGWTVGMDTLDGMTFAACLNGERPVAVILPIPDAATIMSIPDAGGDMPSNWVVYFGVPDFDLSLAKAQELGGTLVASPREHAGYRFALIQDPQGAMFYIMK
jgi:predicted enzyme related to lactoylglutathione lyase